MRNRSKIILKILTFVNGQHSNVISVVMFVSIFASHWCFSLSWLPLHIILLGPSVLLSGIWLTWTQTTKLCVWTAFIYNPVYSEQYNGLFQNSWNFKKKTYNFQVKHFYKNTKLICAWTCLKYIVVYLRTKTYLHILETLKLLISLCPFNCQQFYICPFKNFQLI